MGYYEDDRTGDLFHQQQQEHQQWLLLHGTEDQRREVFFNMEAVKLSKKQAVFSVKSA